MAEKTTIKKTAVKKTETKKSTAKKSTKIIAISEPTKTWFELLEGK